jgi:hypothetical protein
MQKLRSIIFAIFLLLVVSLLLFFYLFNENIQATEGPWEVAKGKDKVTKFEVMPWFGPYPYLYTIPNNKNEVIFAPYTRFYIEPWTPKGKQEGRYVWKLNLNSLLTEPILYEKFIYLKPQFYEKSIKLSEKLVTQQRGYDLAKGNFSDDVVIETIAFNAKGKSYEVKLAVSDFKRLKKPSFSFGFVNKKKSQQDGTAYYSGTMHLSIYEKSSQLQLLIALNKQFRSWSYPLRNDPKRYTEPSIIASFSQLYFLPDSRPCFILLSPVYKGRIYEDRSTVEDKTFSLIIP